MLNKNFRAIHSAVPITGYDCGEAVLVYLPKDSSNSTMNTARTIVNPQNKRIVAFVTTDEDKICCNSSTGTPGNYITPNAFSLVPGLAYDAYYVYTTWSMQTRFNVVDGAMTFCSDQPEELTTTDGIYSFYSGTDPKIACPFIILGAGTTPATEDDYKLESCTLNYKVANCTSSFDPKTAVSSTTLTIRAIEDGDVSEIGLYTYASTKGSSTINNEVIFSSSVARICMVGRKVLDTPIHIQAGKIYNFSYTVDFMLMSDSQ